MARKPHRYSRPVTEIAALLGSEIRQGRIERRWTARELAERAGIGENTLARVEKGEPEVTLGIALECAYLAGVPLVTPDPRELRRELRNSRDRLALMPQRVRRRRKVDDDF